MPRAPISSLYKSWIQHLERARGAFGPEVKPLAAALLALSSGRTGMRRMTFGGRAVAERGMNEPSHVCGLLGLLPLSTHADSPVRTIRRIVAVRGKSENDRFMHG
jgi:hypothetical protein